MDPYGLFFILNYRNLQRPMTSLIGSEDLYVIEWVDAYPLLMLNALQFIYEFHSNFTQTYLGAVYSAERKISFTDMNLGYGRELKF